MWFNFLSLSGRTASEHVTPPVPLKINQSLGHSCETVAPSDRQPSPNSAVSSEADIIDQPVTLLRAGLM